MAQFDVFENGNESTAKQFPFLLEVQSDVFSESNRAVYIPLVHAETLKNPDRVLNSKFTVSDIPVRLFPLDLAAAPRSVAGPKVGDIKNESDKIVAALDLLFARY